jgi:type II secretory pathway pseudopilin PulG
MRGERGLSLVETTIILMVLSVLAAAIAPAARAFVEDGRNVKAAADVETLGAAIDQLLRSTGLPCVSENGTSCDNAGNGLVELLVSGSSTTANEPEVATASLSGIVVGAASDIELNWGGAGGPGGEVANGRKGLMTDHFVTNEPGYAAVSFTGGGGTSTGQGWRGPYLSGPIDLDPWGYVYQASTLFLTVAGNAPDGTGEGERRGGWTSNVVVVSAGSNASIQTAFGAVATTAVGDDIVYVVQGATH